MIIQYNCTCGYTTVLEVGGGLLSNRETSVRSVFNEEELKAFYQAKENGSLTRFYWEKLPACCDSCKDLVALPTLRYWTGEQEHIIKKPCPKCGGETILHSVPVCPKCGKPLRETQLG